MKLLIPQRSTKSSGLSNDACRSILLRAGASVVALSRTETPELTALAGRFPGVLVISKGDVSKDADNKVRSRRVLLVTRQS